jgi:hypothetical protein
MKETTKILMAAVVVGLLAATSMSCNKGPAEKVGESIDKGVQNTKDAVHDAVKGN